MSNFAAPIAEEIWNKKYRFNGETLEGTWRRVARDLASVEKDPAHWEARFFEVLEDFRFLPAGRVTAGAGTARAVTLSNCFVMGTIDDSMGGIFDAVKEAALTMQQGGGIGYDFSTIRPKGAEVKKLGADASGPLSFMDVWDAMCRTIMSAGSRRGAMMATMRCDHPDIEDFITAKQNPTRLRMFNLSVLVTDAFMDAVRNDGDFDLVHVEPPTRKEGDPEPRRNADGEYVHRTVKAKDLWDLIMKSTYAYAEPGVIFIDRVNHTHNIWYEEVVRATNPCGEKPMGPYASCILGSINLTRFVKAPFTKDARIDRDGLAEVVRVAIRMLDNINDRGQFPLPQQQAKALADRQVGLGVTGLADLLLMVGARYGSDEGVAITREVMKIISDSAYDASVNLAIEKGPFPTFDADKFLREGTYASTTGPEIQARIRKHGIRNSLLTSIAPTGTISLYAGNVSSGIEPVFALSYIRKVLQNDGTRTEQRVRDYALGLYEEVTGDRSGDLPDYFVTAQDLSPMDHVRMQAAAQQFVDSSISKTINVPEDISFEEFKDVYMAAYDQGCKGCTTYRPNDVTGSVLSVDTPKKEEPKKDAPVAAPVPGRPMAEPIARPEEVHGSTYKVKWPGNEHALYITVNDIVADGQRRPFEVFINSKNPEHFAWTVALTRMISAVFRRGGDVTFVVGELKAVFDPRGGAWVKGSYVPSVIAMIGATIERHMVSIGYVGSDVSIAPSTAEDDDDLAEAVLGEEKPLGRPCSACGQYTVQKVNGCDTCMSCGDSKCG